MSQPISLNLVGLNYINNSFEDEAVDASRYDAIGNLYPTTLSVSSLAAAAPEPGTWAMMLAGFGLVGFALRRGYRRSEDRFTSKVRVAYA